MRDACNSERSAAVIQLGADLHPVCAPYAAPRRLLWGSSVHDLAFSMGPLSFLEPAAGLHVLMAVASGADPHLCLP